MLETVRRERENRPKTENDDEHMRKVSSAAEAQNWPARALAGKPAEGRQAAKKHPPMARLSELRGYRA